MAGSVVRTNIMAMNANRSLGINNGLVSKSLEKLSSGFRINRAGDDASGLAISEKMKAQIKGLETASANSQDGISLIQTAEGALTEVHNMLNRMVELATKSANGTLQNEVDREALQAEVDSLLEEIDRIGNSTNFNGINLLDGSLATETVADTAVVEGAGKQVMINSSTEDITYVLNDGVKDTFKTATAVGAVTNGATDLTVTVNYTDADGNAKSMDVKVAIGAATAAAATGTAIVAGLNANEDFSKLFTAADTAAGADGKINITSNVVGANGPKVTSFSIASSVPANYTASTHAKDTTNSVAGADPSATVTFAANPEKEDTITIGDKTYEFVAKAGDAVKGEGNIAVVLGADEDATAANLVAAMKENGVSSATADAANNAIKIADLSEISVAQNSVQITEMDEAFLVDAQAATKGEYTMSIGAGTASEKHTFTLKYMDKEGTQKELKVEYDSNATAATNRNNIISELKKNTELSELFDIEASATGSDIVFKAKDAGSEAGRVLAGASTDDEANGTTTVSALATKEPKDAGKVLSLDYAALEEGDTLTVNGKTYEFVQNANTAAKEGNIAIVKGADEEETMKALASALRNDGVEMTFDNGTNTITFMDDAVIPEEKEVGGLQLQIGDTSDSFNVMTVNVDDLRSEALGLSGLDISNADNASAAINTIKDAINKVSTNRANMGALQNRLEYTINNLDVASENMNAANSRIRDTDMAKEMMNYTKMNVLTQAAQAMLAQANQQPQSVLQLLG